MKTEIVNENKPVEINWDKVQVLIGEQQECVLATGVHNGNDFEGICIHNPNVNSASFVGYYSRMWSKNYFTPIVDITIRFTSQD